MPSVERSGAESLTDLVLTTFHLNGRFLEVAEGFAGPVGLTAARWQVVGAVLREPMTVAGIARTMGLARQSVQRTADLLVAGGFAEYLDNPRHRRARLLSATPKAHAAIVALSGATRRWATSVAAGVGAQELADAVAVLHRVAEVLAEGERGDRVGPMPARNPSTGLVWAERPSSEPVSRDALNPVRTSVDSEN